MNQGILEIFYNLETSYKLSLKIGSPVPNQQGNSMKKKKYLLRFCGFRSDFWIILNLKLTTKYLTLFIKLDKEEEKNIC